MSLRSHRPLNPRLSNNSNKPPTGKYGKSHRTYRILHNIVNPDKIDEHKYYETRHNDVYNELPILYNNYLNENISDTEKKDIKNRILKLEQKKPILKHKVNLAALSSDRKGGKTKKRKNNKRKNRKSAKKRSYGK